MTRSTGICLAVCALVAWAGVPAFAAPAAAAVAPSPATHQQYSIQQFLSTVNWGGGAFSPDGKTLLASNDSSGVYNVYAIPLAGGTPVQLTHSAVSAVRSIGYLPDGVRLLYASDQGGNEQSHIFVRNADGSTKDLTPGDKVKTAFLGWSQDDRSFFFGSTARDPQYFDVYEMPVDLSGATMLFKNEGGFQPIEVSSDRRYVALAKPGDGGSQDSDVYLFDVKAGEVQNLTAHQGEVANSPVAFTSDARELFFTSDAGAEFSYLQRYELSTKKVTTALHPDWDVSGGQISRDGRYFAVSINADARTETHLYELPAMHEITLPAVPDADVTGVLFSHDSRQLAFYAESSREPRNLFVLALGSKGAVPHQLTRSLNPAIDPRNLVVAERIRFASYDGLQIPGILYRPHGAAAGHLVPALVSVHGGPGGQSRVGYSATTQFLVNHGYAVFAINNRGSSGYGKTFLSLDDRKHGEVDLDDCVASKGMLKATGWVDPDRIGIMGGSYGGYMVLAALTFRPREFVLGVDLFGVANWVRTLESIPPDWAAFRKSLYKEMGDPQTDHDYLVRISPLFHTEKIERPLIVLQGENDPRVLRRESDEIVAALRARNVPVEYEIYPNEGHGFVRKDTQAKAFGAILAFLDKYLVKSPT